MKLSKSIQQVMVATSAIGLGTVVAAPASAQGAEEARTTYQVSFLEFEDGADERWNEIMTDHYIPAYRSAGLPVPVIHWVMDGSWNIMIVREMPDGMATLDSHNSRSRTAWRAALVAQLGSEEAFETLIEEVGGLIEDGARYFTHTHP
ncbi:MAG: hypothetical protein HKN78_05715 [Sphingomonadaceae bacterium]|nr:hypothetical protein [Sphingomonadaceae bacterium]